MILLIGNVVFRRFDPRMRLWQRIAKSLGILAVTAIVSRLFGTTGVLVALALALAPVLYIHGIWLPRHGINGWTGEPKEKYYALRGWTLDK